MSNPFVYPVFRPGRKDPCFCQSGKRFKACCGSTKTNRKPPHGVHILRGFLDPQSCRAWVAHLERQPRLDSGVYDEYRTQDRSVGTSLQKGRTSQKVDPGELMDALKFHCARAFQSAPRLFGRQVEWFEMPKILRYGPSQHYGTHADNCHRRPEENFWTKKIDRDISMLIYLNEEFRGGSLSFEKFAYDYQPRTGDLLLFPSDNRYKHGANPVTAGVRYAVVSWAAFLGEPRVHETPLQQTVEMADFAR
jgi:predicted 2-oxoglutarate/Fe(II)-dependent dioxygenase YbiX